MRVVVVTALELEYRAMEAHLIKCVEVVNPTTKAVYITGVLALAPDACDICLVQSGRGNDPAALEAAAATAYFSPEVVLLVGIAGGLKDVAPGDVVAASHVWNYERAKVYDGTIEHRPDGGPCSYALVARARAVSRADHWKADLDGNPKSWVEPIVAGDKVVADRDSMTFRAIRQSYGDAVAIEMEGHGVYEAVHRHRVDGIAIRGISRVWVPRSASSRVARPRRPKMRCLFSSKA